MNAVVNNDSTEFKEGFERALALAAANPVIGSAVKVDENDEWDAYHKRFKGCPYRCIDRIYIDPYKHRKMPCPYCSKLNKPAKIAECDINGILETANIFEQYKDFVVKGLDDLFSSNDSWYIKFRNDVPSNLSEWATGIILRLVSGGVTSIRYIEGLEQDFSLKYKDLDVLVIAYETRINADVLFELLAYRYNRGLRTIILSKSGYKLGARLQEYDFIVKGE